MCKESPSLSFLELSSAASLILLLLRLSLLSASASSILLLLRSSLFSASSEQVSALFAGFIHSEASAAFNLLHLHHRCILILLPVFCIVSLSDYPSYFIRILKRVTVCISFNSYLS